MSDSFCISYYISCMSSLIGKLASKIEIWFGNGKKNETHTLKQLSQFRHRTLEHSHNDADGGSIHHFTFVNLTIPKFKTNNNKEPIVDFSPTERGRCQS